MWNFFSRESFPYEILEKAEDFQGFSVFSLQRGIRKNNGEEVSIFTYTKKLGNSFFLDVARSAVKKLKTLKHPNLLTYLDSHEDEQFVHLVTNYVVPLLSYLKKTKKCEHIYLSWGLATVGEAVAFLNDANLRHNNIFHGSIFVDDTGCWKLGEMGYMTNLTDPFPKKCSDYLAKYAPPEVKNTQSTALGNVDVWGLGVLMWEVFNGELVKPETFGSASRIPKNMLPLFNEMTHSSVSKRATVSKFTESLTKNNLLQDTLNILGNFHLKEKHLKMKGCKNVLLLLNAVPKDILVKKVVTLIKQSHEFDAESGSLLVPVVSRISCLATEDEFHKYIEPFVVNLFSSNDRATRLTLLLEVKDLVSKMYAKTVNDVFPFVLNGFLDTNIKIRGETIKAMVFFAPKLSSKNLNEETLRNLVHLQTMDPEMFIRTNSTICLGKIAMYILPSNRKKILLTGFLRALRDPASHVRNAGTQAFAVTHVFFTLEEIARGILPGLVCLTVDPCNDVRENAFKTIRILLEKLEKVSENPSLKEEMEKHVQSQSFEQTATNSWSGWAFAAITSKLLKSGDSARNATSLDSSEKTDTNTIQNISKVDMDNRIIEEGDGEYISGKEDTEEEEEYGKLEGWDVEEWSDATAPVGGVVSAKEGDVALSGEGRRRQEPPLSRKPPPPGPMKLGTRLNKT